MKNPISKTDWLIFSSIILFNLIHFYSKGQVTTAFELKKIHSSMIQSGTVPVTKTQTKNIAVKDGYFVDPTGRTMFIRGINLGGSTKVPYSPNGSTYINKGFFNGKDISFVGRPFPLAEADIHFQRLKAWGYHFIRFLVTWEAIEHEGPGIYDQDYLNYVKSLVIKANEWGINVMIDPHQDVWSRFSGGDGAPMWTFDLVGMDVTKFHETGAAFVHNIYGDPFPQMIWYTNYYKLASATMFTLFFGGNDFAPKTNIERVPVQDFLQQHYINALVQVAKVLKGLPNMIGFELMNEPSAGYIGIEDISKPFQTEITGVAPTAWQGILAGEGIAQKAKSYSVGAVSLKNDGDKLLNPYKISVWKGDKPGIWIQNGVGDKLPDGSIKLKNAKYFAMVKGQKVDFNKQYYEPFARKYAKAINEIDSSWLICVDNVLFPYAQKLPALKEVKGVTWINGSHWYDDVTLVKKQYLPFLGIYERKIIFGKKKVQKAFEKTLANMIEQTHKYYGNTPSLLGEFGIPFDMNNARAYQTGIFKTQAKALDRSFRIAEKNLLNYTLWNYTADNTNERGDNWNGEDLSIFSVSQQSNPADINSGGRALDAAIRPFPNKIAGKLLEYSYNYRKKELLVRFSSDKLDDNPTEIFIPEYTYGNNFSVRTNKVKLAFDNKERILLCFPETTGEHVIIIK